MLRIHIGSTSVPHGSTSTSSTNHKVHLGVGQTRLRVVGASGARVIICIHLRHGMGGESMWKWGLMISWMYSEVWCCRCASAGKRSLWNPYPDNRVPRSIQITRSPQRWGPMQQLPNLLHFGVHLRGLASARDHPTSNMDAFYHRHPKTWYKQTHPTQNSSPQCQDMWFQ